MRRFLRLLLEALDLAAATPTPATVQERHYSSEEREFQQWEDWYIRGPGE